MSTYDRVLAETKRVRERNRKDYEALAAMTGRSIAEIEADLTASDPGLEEPDGEA
jgi:hypothetical protein